MAKRLYVKEGMEFEGISMQQEKSSSQTFKLLGFILVTVVLLGVLIFAAGKFLTKSDGTKKPISAQPTSVKEKPTETPTPSPTPVISGKVTPLPSIKLTSSPTVKTTPSPAVTGASKKSSLKIEVLNGSGLKGAAGKMSTTLTDAGYSVSATGNADSFDYKGVTVTIKKSMSTSLDQLKKDLSAAGYVVSTSNVSLAESSTYDVIVTVGSE